MGDRGRTAIDRGGQPSREARDTQTFGELIDLHSADLQEVGRSLGRSKTASLTLLEHRLGAGELLNLTASG